jgi:hypothetical protein
MSTMDTMVGYADTPTRRVTADNAIEYAYRELGDGDVPLVLLQHFRGNLDNWDGASPTTHCSSGSQRSTCRSSLPTATATP